MLSQGLQAATDKLSRCCRLFLFPKPQVWVYTLFMVPVIYSASKLVATSMLGSPAHQAGVASIVLLPTPILCFWAWILWRVHSLSQTSTIQASTKYLASHSKTTVKATLALLGSADDNPTLIIRDRRSGEEVLESRLSEDDATGWAIRPALQLRSTSAAQTTSGESGESAWPLESSLMAPGEQPNGTVHAALLSPF